MDDTRPLYCRVDECAGIINIIPETHGHDAASTMCDKCHAESLWKWAKARYIKALREAIPRLT